jgi:hypothetical protein
MLQTIFTKLAQVQIDPPPFQVKTGDFANGLNRVFFWAGAIAVIAIVIAGIQYITSNGDSSKIVNSKKAIIYSSIGLVIVLLSFAIVNIVLRNF